MWRVQVGVDSTARSDEAKRRRRRSLSPDLTIHPARRHTASASYIPASSLCQSALCLVHTLDCHTTNLCLEMGLVFSALWERIRGKEVCRALLFSSFLAKGSCRGRQGRCPPVPRSFFVLKFVFVRRRSSFSSVCSHYQTDRASL
jgi:hypothetical protein